VLSQFVTNLIQSPNARAELSLDVLGMASRYELTVTPIYNVLGALNGHLLILRDITEQRHTEDKLQQLALTDSLTGCLNRRAFFELAAPEFERSLRYHRPLSFILLDVDNFKKVNDTYGHLVGDQVLEGMAHACQHSLRDSDKLARYGGEEFVVMLPETDADGVRLAAERLRQIIETVAVKSGQSSVHITASLGVTTFEPDQAHYSLDRLLGQADQALYRAKQAGRNRIWVWQDEETTLFTESLRV
jgi:diguanylate cyclase (GGDEF)-like protein